MFGRFMRHLLAREVTFTTPRPGHLELFFFPDVTNRRGPNNTRPRYARLVDRRCRHLVSLEPSNSSPATHFQARGKETNRSPQGQALRSWRTVLAIP
jgi:hypothetical protein